MQFIINHLFIVAVERETERDREQLLLHILPHSLSLPGIFTEVLFILVMIVIATRGEADRKLKCFESRGVFKSF